MTREEALQAIKARMDYYESDKRLRCAIETLIPELAESEDERALKGLQNFLWRIANGEMNDRGTMPSAKMCQEWIAYLEEQKPAEWSEEEKRKLNRIYGILGQAADEKPFGSSKRIIGDKEAVELQDFIKSLRPSWKPSDVCYGFKGDPDPAGVWKPSKEQMNALYYACCNAFKEERWFHPSLSRLYHDLMKLIRRL